MRMITRFRQHLCALLALGGLCLFAPAPAAAQNNAPAVPAAIDQFVVGFPANTAIPVGAFVGATPFEFDGTVTDPDGDNVTLEIEIQLVGTAFTNVATNTGASFASGSTATVNVVPLADGAYHWQARAVDAFGAASAFVSFGGNLETDADFIVDTTPPAAPVIASPANGSTTSDVTPTLSGTAEANALLSFDDGGAPLGPGAADGAGNWNFTTPPLADGAHVLSVFAVDAAGNAGPAAGITITIDTTAPTVVVSPSGTSTNASPIVFTLTFSEPVAGLAAGAITVTNGAKGALAGGPTVYTIPVTPTAPGAVTCLVTAAAAQDAAGNNNTVSNTASVTYDTTAPTVAVTPNGTITGVSPITFTLTFSESVANLAAAGITVTNGAKGALAGGPTVYTIPVTPTADGAVTCLVTAGAAQDAAGNNNTVSNTASVTYDSIPFTVAVTPSGTSTGTSPITFTMTFSKPVALIAADAIGVANGTKGLLTGGPTVYTIPVTPTAQGAVLCQVAAGGARDAAGNSNTVSNTASVTYDSIAPTVTVTATGNSTNAPSITFTMTFLEPVTGLTSAGITVTNGTKGALAAVSATVYTIPVTPTAEGAVTCLVTAGAAQDAAGNNNTDSNTASVTYDTTAPTVTVTPDGTTTGLFPIAFTLTFSEPVTGLTSARIAVTNGIKGFLTGGPTVYTIPVTPTANGAVTCLVAAGAAQDAAGNNNTVSNTASVTYASILPPAPAPSGPDTTAPTVTVTSATASASTPTITFTATFSEDVEGLSASDLGAWTQTTAFTTARFGHTSVAYNGYLYVIGGQDAGGRVDDVQFAPIGANGTVGTWATTAPFAQARLDHTSVAYNGYLYVIGGNGISNGYNNDVQYAPIHADGTVGPWASTASFAIGRSSHTSVVYNGYLYVLGGSSPGGEMNDVQYAPIHADGTVGPWASTTSFAIAREDHTSVAYNGYLYVIGGTSLDDSIQTTLDLGIVQYAPIHADGSVGAWASTSTLNVASSTSVAHDGYLYVLGDTNGVMRARANANGTLGAWASASPFATNRIRAGSAISNDYLYIIGGRALAGNFSLNDVQFAPLTSDFTVTNGTIGTLTDVSPSIYTLTVTPTGEGPVTCLVRGGVAQDAAGNVNAVSNTASVTYTPADPPPTVVVTPDGTSTEAYPMSFTLTFSEPVTGLTATELGPWGPTTSMMKGRFYHASVAYRGYVYAIGGYSGQLLNDVEYAPISADGTVGVWAATTSIPTPLAGLTAVAYNGFLYAIGGDQEGELRTDKILYAPIKADGTVGAWVATTALSRGIAFHSSAVYNGYLYVIGGAPALKQYASDIQFAPIHANGTVGTWAATTALPTARESHTSVAYKGNLYVIAGEGSPGDVQFAPINANGTVGAWTATTALPRVTTGHASVVSNDFLFVSGGGGSSYDNGRNDLQYAPINADGTVGSWTTAATRFNTGRLYHASVAYNGHLYVIGGHGSTGALNDIQFVAPTSEIAVTNGVPGTLSGGPTVYTLQVFPNAAGDVTCFVPAGVAQDSANGGNLASNTATVKFTGKPPAEPTTLCFVGRPGGEAPFAGAKLTLAFLALGLGLCFRKRRTFSRESPI